MNKNNYYTAVNRKRLAILQQVTKNPRHAQVLDLIVYLSTNTKISRPGDNDRVEGWTCYTYERIAQDTGYTVRTINTLVKKFITDGFIEKSVKKFYGDTRAFLRITNKIKALLGLELHQGKQEEGRGVIKVVDNHQDNSVEPPKERKNFEHNFTSKTAKISGAYIKKKQRKEICDINTIDFSKTKNTTAIKKQIPAEYQAIAKRLGERMLDSQKRYLITTIENLLHKDQVVFSGKKSELFAQMAYAILNDSYLKTAKDFPHRVNIYAKLLRDKRWKVPNGFHKYFDIGQELKAQQEARSKEHEQLKRGQGGNELSFEESGHTGEDVSSLPDPKALTKEKARIENEMRVLKSKKDSISRLFKHDAAMLSQQSKRFDKEASELTVKLEAVELKLRKIVESRAPTQPQSMEPLYA